jgi:peptidoglycan lytic transglycosylase
LLSAFLLLAFSLVSLSVSAQQSKSRKSTTPHKSAKSARASKSKSKKKKKRPLSARELQRMKRMHRAFVASSTLKPMAKQLFEVRTKEGYAAIEAYAAKHVGTDEGAMANLVLGYAHVLDKEYPQAVPFLKKAQVRAGDLGDYVAFFLAQAQMGNQDQAQTIAALEGFQQKYPASIFARDAAAMQVNALLNAGQAEKAIALATKYRSPVRSDLELNLGRAYMKSGDTPKAIETLRRIYYTMPLSAEADAAGADLGSLAGLPGSFGERKTRAELLAQAKRYQDAARDYRELLNIANTQEQKDQIQVALAIAEYRGGDSKDARKVLESLRVSGNAEAQRLYLLSDIARSDDDEGRFKELVDQIRQVAPTSNWFEQALLSGANMYLLKREYDKSIDFYRELEQRFSAGKWGHYAHWKSSWLSLRQGRAEDAKNGFEQQIAKYADSAEVPAALYWRARLAEDNKDAALARAYYSKVIERFTNYYYADRARERMALLGQGAVASDPLLDHVPPLNAMPKEFIEVPEDDLRVQKSRLLENCAMFDFAVKELQRASSSSDNADWTAGEIARLYQESGGYHRALNYLKRTVPSYFSMDYSALPRNYWETLFPRPYWTDLQRYSSANSLDPYLVASLIRQESEFNPGAISRANALGLMQVLPGTGKKLAKDMNIRHFTPDQLLTPNTNIQLGTRYFKQLLEKFNGTPEYALAAYNAGTNRVEDWLAAGTYRDASEFVESIPFTETREYVQAIMRNATVYRKLYSSQ